MAMLARLPTAKAEDVPAGVPDVTPLTRSFRALRAELKQDGWFVRKPWLEAAQVNARVPAHMPLFARALVSLFAVEEKKSRETSACYFLCFVCLFYEKGVDNVTRFGVCLVLYFNCFLSLFCRASISLVNFGTAFH